MATPGTLYIVFDCGERNGTAYIERACPKCARFLKSDAFKLEINGLDQARAEADCPKCGKVKVFPEFL